MAEKFSEKIPPEKSSKIAWVIPRPIVNRILTHAMKTAPEECVGLLSGNGRKVKAWHPMTNSLHHERRFLADPSQQIQIMKALRGRDEDIVAIYHSHPMASAEPSLHDFENAHYPDALCLIVSLDTRGRLDMNGFLLKDGHAEPQELALCD